jgi:hypothetical protein
MSNEAKQSKWIKEFEQKYGRLPSILHIGNIANNAYNNAKLLNEAGFDCDVICYDYYHIMGCPEWEDADFEGEIKNQFFPDWTSVKLNNFKRPNWFVQSKLKFCLNYLIAKRTNQKVRAFFWWNMVNLYRFLRCYPLSMTLNENIKVIKDKIKNLTTIINKIPIIGKVILYGYKTITNLILFLFYLLITFLFLTIGIPILIYKLIKYLNNQKLKLIEKNQYCFDNQVNFLINKYREYFSEREDQLSALDLEMYRPFSLLWQKLLNQYDIIQAYSTDPILPLLANKNYFAFEHGTLRDIPFQQDSQGRNTALSYTMATHVFVTNADCLENAHKLSGDKVSFINHPFDECHGDKVEGTKELRENLAKLLDAEFLFFYPTRHDWVIGTGYADKANDTFLNAFCQLRQKGYKVGMICCQWGKNIQESMTLLQENNCEKFVLWQEPMGTIKFERTAKACDVVVDQFKLGSFGGILFKAMAVGSPICTYLDEQQILKEYPEVPPVINCQTTDQLIHKLADIIQDSSKLNDLSLASIQWIKKYHSSLPTIKTQIDQYRKFLNVIDSK